MSFRTSSPIERYPHSKPQGLISRRVAIALITRPRVRLPADLFFGNTALVTPIDPPVTMSFLYVNISYLPFLPVPSTDEILSVPGLWHRVGPTAI